MILRLLFPGFNRPNPICLGSIALLTALVCPCILAAQPSIKAGFIIKNNRDTVRGYLRPIAEKQLGDRISFTADKSREPTAFTREEIAGFGFNDENSFKTITCVHPYTGKTQTQFAKLLVDGYYRLYMYWKSDRRFYIINTYEDSTYLLFDDVFSSTSGILDEKGNYKNQLLFLTVACESMKPALEYLSFDESNMARFVDKLNKCVLPYEQNAIVYKKGKSYFKIYGYAAGLVLPDGHEFTGRIMTRVTLPDLDNKMSIHTGFNFMAHKRTSRRDLYGGGSTKEIAFKNIYSIPLTVQYDFTRGWIRPYIDAGLSLVYLETKGEVDFYNRKRNDSGFGVGFIIATGVEGFITQRLFIKADWRYELFLHYPTIGVGYYFK